MDTLRNKYKTSQAQHDNRRHELDMHLLEIEDLRKALTERENELERAEAEKARVGLEKTGFMKTVRALEADLLRVRKDAERFGDDLKALKKERDKLEEKRKLEKERAEKAERGEKQLKARMKLMGEELAGDKERGRRILEEWQTHICAAYVLPSLCSID
jgi:myosin protein heavy chain